MSPRPARNRVGPLGDILAVPGRGAWMGNRGRLHEGRGTRDVVRNHRTTAWLICMLSFKDRRVAQWDPHRYTPLFFLDEAVAFAAGHRPCAECRRSAFTTFQDAWQQTQGGARPRAGEMDAQLRAERRRDGTGARRLHHVNWSSLPDGAFVLIDQGPAVVVGDHLAVWDGTQNRYGPHFPRPSTGTAAVVTPPSTVAILRAGYPVQVDAAAR